MDEFAARFDDVAHQLGENLIGFRHVSDLDLQERALIGVERRLPKLFGIYFAQAFVALQVDALAARLVNGFKECARAGYVSTLSLRFSLAVLS